MSRRKSPAEFCIFCGADDSDRTREHIIPRALAGGRVQDGKFVWPEATCRRCQDIFNSYERKAIKNIFPGIAFHHKISTSQSPINIERQFYIDGKLQPVTLKQGEEPPVQSIPHLYPAGIFRDGDPESTEFKLYKLNGSDLTYRMCAAYSEETLEKIGSKTFWNDTDFDLFDLARLLCKIAHGVAVRELGINWLPFALPIALRCSDFAPYIVGTRWRFVEGDELHYIRLKRSEFRGYHYYIAEISFFTVGEPQERPVYEVVVGRETELNATHNDFEQGSPGPDSVQRLPSDPIYYGWPMLEF